MGLDRFKERASLREVGALLLRMLFPLIGGGQIRLPTSKNKCGPGQPPEPHCYRGRSNCRLPPRRKIIAQRHSEERHAPMTSWKLALHGYVSAFPSFSKEGLLRRPLSPGTSALDMRRFFPPVIHSRETTGNAEPLSQQFQNISRFDCKHFAIAEKLTQR
jgi:hypothetical protein